MFCSTIIPTVNRPVLSRAVCSVLDQVFAGDSEVIIVNDSGQPLPNTDWQHSDRVQVINTNRHERSVARNTGAAIARGKYLHFLDDDDCLLPGALETFWTLDQKVQAAWLYGCYQTVDNDDNLVSEFCPGIYGDIFALLVAGESIPFQASLLDTKQFHDVGAFDVDPGIIGVEDRELGRRLAMKSSVAYAPVAVAKIRIGEQSSTTNWSTIGESDRWGREKALSIHGAPARLRASADSSYLYGRVCRAYLASTVWNLKRKQVFTATSRATTALSFTGLKALSPGFWKGIRSRITRELILTPNR